MCLQRTKNSSVFGYPKTLKHRLSLNSGLQQPNSSNKFTSIQRNTLPLQATHFRVASSHLSQSQLLALVGILLFNTLQYSASY